MIGIDLEGKVALVTGASRGIGRETARFLAAAGARVGINYAQNEARARSLAEELGESALLLEGSVGDPHRARTMINDLVEHFGRIDILVNNAATFSENRFDRDDSDGWERGWQQTFEVNLFGPANLFHATFPLMKCQGGGKVINVASRAAFRGETEFADYGASKAALVNLTKSIARSCGRYNIISTCVAPGWIETDMATADLALRRDEIVAEIPLGRVGTPADIAGIILFLASPFADYLNGATLDANGGSYVR
ncbi:MAG TPA: SDR family oxidoreductase [Thermoanaerobaculia bacterium]|nr:SDR family oxidoreductase [Thermoanaerobaculia bacterium]